MWSANFRFVIGIGLLSLISSPLALASLDRLHQFMFDVEDPRVSNTTREAGASVASMANTDGHFFLQMDQAELDTKVAAYCLQSDEICGETTMQNALRALLNPFQYWPGNPMYIAVDPIFDSWIPYFRGKGEKSVVWQLDPWEQRKPDTRHDPGVGKCTAFLIGPDLVLTNNHCISTQEKCEISSFRFNEEASADRSSLKEIESFDCKEMILTDSYLDVTLLRLSGRPSVGPVKLTSRVPKSPDLDCRIRWLPYPKKVCRSIPGESLTVIGHPAQHEEYPEGPSFNTIKKVSKSCNVRSDPFEHKLMFQTLSNGFTMPYADIDRLFTAHEFKDSPSRALRFLTDCAILGGNSGSPVFDPGMNVIGIASTGNNWVDTDLPPESFVVPMSAILAKYRTTFEELGIHPVEDTGVVVVDKSSLRGVGNE